MSHVKINTTQNPAYGDVDGGGGSLSVKLNHILPGDAGVDVTLLSGGFFALATAFGTNVFINNANGRVGIGTNTPQQLLHVAGAEQIDTNIIFTKGVAHTIAPQNAGAGLVGDNLTISSGTSTSALLAGGVMTILSGNGGPGTGGSVSGPGGDLIVQGGDGGADNGGGGAHGGNVFVQGGLSTINSGQLGFGEQGSVIIGETTTDEIRFGHKPVSGLDYGHVLLRGEIAPNRFDATDHGLPQADWASIRFESDVFPANVTTAIGAAGVAATGMRFYCGQPVADFGGGFVALVGGTINIFAGTGSDGNGTHIAGAGSALTLLGGNAGANGGGGGANGGNVVIDAGSKTGAGTAGLVSIGQTVADEVLIGSRVIEIGPSAATTNIDIGFAGKTLSIFSTLSEDILIDGSGGSTKTISVSARTSAGTASGFAIRGSNSSNGIGGTVFISGGIGTNNNGGSLSLLAGSTSGGTFGGSVLIDSGLGDVAADNGAIDLGTTNASSVRIVKAAGKLAFFTNSSAGVVQQTPPGITTAGFTANASANAVFAESTFTGNVGASAYTNSDVVRCLKNYGLLAA